jgi:ATP-dependent Clp protease ATP-binding subunit ClpC
VNGYNFTERVRRVLAVARDESHRLHHEYVGTEHILLGLMSEDAGIAAAVFENLKIDLSDVRKRVHEVVKIGKSSAGNSDLPYTSRAKRVLELSMHSARDLKHNYVGTEHILLGLLREEKGIGAQVLTEAGLTFEGARDEVRRLLEGGPGDTVVTGSPGIVGVKVQIQFEDGSELRKDCDSIADAVAFLNRQ